MYYFFPTLLYIGNSLKQSWKGCHFTKIKNKRCGDCLRLRTCIKREGILAWGKKKNKIFGRQVDFYIRLTLCDIMDKLITSFLCDNDNITIKDNILILRRCMQQVLKVKYCDHKSFLNDPQHNKIWPYVNEWWHISICCIILNIYFIVFINIKC